MKLIVSIVLRGVERVLFSIIWSIMLARFGYIRIPLRQYPKGQRSPFIVKDEADAGGFVY